jgi:hypothetical protein
MKPPDKLLDYVDAARVVDGRARHDDEQIRLKPWPHLPLELHRNQVLKTKVQSWN